MILSRRRRQHGLLSHKRRNIIRVKMKIKNLRGALKRRKNRLPKKNKTKRKTMMASMIFTLIQFSQPVSNCRKKNPMSQNQIQNLINLAPNKMSRNNGDGENKKTKMMASMILMRVRLILKINGKLSVKMIKLKMRRDTNLMMMILMILMIQSKKKFRFQ